MPREEVAEIVRIVENKIEELADEKRTFDVICCGSYRRFLFLKFFNSLYLNLEESQHVEILIFLLQERMERISLTSWLNS